MRLNAFGRAHITGDGGEEVALQPLAVAVLSYLVVEGPSDRDHLANLFWHNGKNALNSLSTTLNRIRAQVPNGVWVRGNTLVGTDLTSDVGDMREALDRSDFERVIQLYRAPFLGVLRLRGPSIEFEEWVLEQRTTMATMVEVALLQRGRSLFEAGEHSAAAVVVEEAWKTALRDGFPSPDYFEMYHRILASAARPSANAVRSMAEELGIELSPVEPIALASSAESPATGTAPLASLAGDPNASGAKPLFGCEEELDAIASSVASQALTTLVGLGGSGKTRLAAEFFNSSETERAFAHRYWVNLGDVAEQELVAPAIATSLGQRFDTVESLAEQLPDDEPTLLVLDNFEHVVEAAAVVGELVQATETLRILVTSRVPLEVAPESLIKLNGLRTAEREPDSPAEQLFVSSARRAGVTDDRLGGPNRAAILDICRRVGGNPLALEIAGGWAQVLSPTEILEALSVDNELLGSPVAGDLRTMEAVLTQSWATLTETDQNSLMLLATFPGGCLTTEALKLRELSIGSVGRLVKYSLVRRNVEGRFTLHPLVTGHALAELEQRPDRQRAFHQILSDWCRSFALAAEQLSPSGMSSPAFSAEIANFSSAWAWDARHRLWDLHRATLRPLRLFFAESGRYREGRALFETMLDALRADPTPDQDLLAAALEALGWLHLQSGELTRARTLLAEALELSSGHEPHDQAQILRSLGVLHLHGGEIDEAATSLTESLSLLADDPSPLRAAVQFDLAQVHHFRGDRAQAARVARLALQTGRSTNDWAIMTTSYLLLADIAVETDPERAIVLLNEGWVIAKDASLDSLAIYFPFILGLAHLKLGEVKTAENYFTDGIEAATVLGKLTEVCASYIGRAEAGLLLERSANAIEDLKTGIRLALKTGSARYLMWAAVVSCRVAAEQAVCPQAKELLLLTLGHPASDKEAQDKAIETLRDLFDMAPPASDVPVSDDATLDEVAERSLHLLTLR